MGDYKNKIVETVVTTARVKIHREGIARGDVMNFINASIYVARIEESRIIFFGLNAALQTQG